MQLEALTLGFAFMLGCLFIEHGLCSIAKAIVHAKGEGE